MTAYTTLSNALVAVGAKPFATTVQALRDNPLAISEGDASAHSANVGVRLAALQQLVAGDTTRLLDTTTRTNTTTTFITVLSPGIAQVGQVRIKFEHRSPSGTSNAEARIVRTRAGSATTIVTFATASSSFVARSQDVDVLPGDLVTVQHRHTQGSPSSSELRNAELSTDAGRAPMPMDNFGLWNNLP